MTAIGLDVATSAPSAFANLWRRLRDVWVMTRRNLVHIAREPMQLSDVTVQPVLFTVLFVYIFGSGMSLPGGASYTDFAIAGLLTLNLVTSSMGTGVGLATDLSTGDDRALPDPSNVEGVGAGGPHAVRSAVGCAVRNHRRLHWFGRGLAPRARNMVCARGVRRGAPVQLRAHMANRMPRPPR